MQSTNLNVRDLPDYLIKKLHSDTISLCEENGRFIIQPAKPVMPKFTQADLERRKAAWERLKEMRGTLILPKDFDYKKDKLERLDEKYGRVL